MIRNHRAGFTLVELMVVAVLTAIILGATYQSLMTQERTHRTTGEIIRGQDALRAALGIIEAELREAATMGDPTVIGARDIVAGSPDSLTVRAQRTLGFVCEVHPSDRRMFVWSIAQRDRFRVDDGLYIYADDNPNRAADDRWLPGRAHQVQAASVACPTRPAGTTGAIQRIDVGGLDGSSIGGGYLDPVRVGSPVRGFHRVTYKLFAHEGGWFLGRRVGAATAPDTLVFGLAGPGEGLVFNYLDEAGNLLELDFDPLDILGGGSAEVRGVQATARTAPRPGTGASPVSVTSEIYFRNN